VSEAIHLRYNDISPDGLVIRHSKFKKTRLVPLHDTTRAALERYLERRRSYAPFDDHVFISLRRKPLRLGDVDFAFRNLVANLGLQFPPGMLQPSPHSLRHTFAVRALESCAVDRDHVKRHTVALTSYLGHSSVTETFWYLQGTPDLMTSIAQRCEHFVTGRQA
jgi:integrase